MLGAVAGQGPQQDHDAGRLQRAVVLPAARHRVHGVRQATQAGVPRVQSRRSTAGQFRFYFAELGAIKGNYSILHLDIGHFVSKNRSGCSVRL